MRWAGPLLAAVVLYAGPGFAGSRHKAAEASVEAKAPAKAESKSVPTTPAPVIAKGRLFAVVLGPGAAWKKGQPFKGPGLDAHRLYWRGSMPRGGSLRRGRWGTGRGWP